MAHHLDVFVSSTSIDLRPHRQAVREAILDLLLYPIMMENFLAERISAVNKCRRAVDDAEIFVGIYAKRYGWVPTSEQGGDGTNSITALEYAWAKARGIPMLCFVLDEECEWPDAHPHVDKEPEKAALLKTFKGQVTNEFVIKKFTTSEDLRAHVVAALAHAVKDITGEEQERTVGVWRRPVGPSLAYNFVGRADDQQALTDLLADGEGPVTVVSGTGGIGKTFLAQHMTHALKEQFPGGVLWVSLGPEARHAETEVPRVLAAWAGHHQQGRHIPYDKLTPDLVRGLLADAPGRLLVVFDDVWHPAPVTQLRAALPEGTACLVTTRLSKVAALGRRYPLERLTDADAYALIEDRLRVATIDPDELRECIAEIVQLLNGHALALDLAARQIIMHWRHDAARYVDRLRKHLTGEQTPFKLLRLGAQDEGTRDDSLEAALYMSYERLTEDQQAKYRALGVLAPDATFGARTAFATWNIDVENDDSLRRGRRAACAGRGGTGAPTGQLAGALRAAHAAAHVCGGAGLRRRGEGRCAGALFAACDR
ncbi:MAG: DUF4062 domain-containing protein [Anaerolineae bacterium]|nr:DUF4062 domain-containing protein [Anaerolineae bacterium]